MEGRRREAGEGGDLNDDVERSRKQKNNVTLTDRKIIYFTGLLESPKCREGFL